VGTHWGIVILRVPYFYTANEINAVLNGRSGVREIEKGVDNRSAWEISHPSAKGMKAERETRDRRIPHYLAANSNL
jgi:hypothetical protein